jgi:hypothetical protein
MESTVLNPVTRRIASGLLTLVGFLLLLAHGQALPATLATPDDWTGSWHGTYVCAQGVTGLSLAIKPSGVRSVSAIFSFYAVPQNPSVPSGEFAMTGRLREAGHLELLGTAWRRQPSFYVMVDLDGDYDPTSGEYRGHVHGPGGCGLFHLRRDLVS